MELIGTIKEVGGEATSVETTSFEIIDVESYTCVLYY